MTTIIEIIINAIAPAVGSGIGTAIGIYFANKALIKNIESLEQRFKRGNSHGEKRRGRQR